MKQYRAIKRFFWPSPWRGGQRGRPRQMAISLTLSWFMHKAKSQLFFWKKNWELYNIFCPRKAKIPGKGFLLCTEGWLWAGWEWRGWGEEKPVTDGWYWFEILHMRLFLGKVRGFTEALLDTEGDWNGASGERRELSPVLREIKTQ